LLQHIRVLLSAPVSHAKHADTIFRDCPTMQHLLCYRKHCGSVICVSGSSLKHGDVIECANRHKSLYCEQCGGLFERVFRHEESPAEGAVRKRGGLHYLNHKPRKNLSSRKLRPGVCCGASGWRAPTPHVASDGHCLCAGVLQRPLECGSYRHAPMEASQSTYVLWSAVCRRWDRRRTPPCCENSSNTARCVAGATRRRTALRWTMLAC
jgi:hypothetical protein